MALILKALHRMCQFSLFPPYIGRLGCLEGIWETPPRHRVHRGRNPQYLNESDGGMLSIRDRIFGTFAPETEKVEYGLVKQIKTHNPLKMKTIGITRISPGPRRARSLAPGGCLLFSKPGTPETSAKEDHSAPSGAHDDANLGQSQELEGGARLSSAPQGTFRLPG